MGQIVIYFIIGIGLAAIISYLSYLTERAILSLKSTEVIDDNPVRKSREVVYSMALKIGLIIGFFTLLAIFLNFNSIMPFDKKGSNDINLDMQRSTITSIPTPTDSTGNIVGDTIIYQLVYGEENKIDTFGFPGQCDLSIQMRKLKMNIYLTEGKIIAFNTNVECDSKERIVKCDASVVNAPIKENTHVYTISKTPKILGDTIKIEYIPSNRNIPQCNLTFTGTISNDLISGDLKWSRTDQKYGEYNYTINRRIILILNKKLQPRN